MITAARSFEGACRLFFGKLIDTSSARIPSVAHSPDQSEHDKLGHVSHPRACLLDRGDGVTFVPVTASFGARYIASRAAATIAGHAALDALAEHVAGCDAVYLACFGDPGLSALKELSPVPVVGMAEAACREAARSGRRFSIVTGGVLWKAMLQEYVVGLGLAPQLASIRVIEPTGDQIAKNPDAALDALASACWACASEDGAEIVILGGAALAGLASRLQRRVPVPVLCSVEVGTRTAIQEARRGMHIVGRHSQPNAQSSIGLSLALNTMLEEI